MIIDFGKIWTAMVLINLAILLVNFTGIFPEQWSPYLKGIEDTYNQINQEVQEVQGISEQDILAQAGAMGFILLLGLKMAIQITVLAPVYVGITINNFFASLGIPAPIGYVFTIITYFSFIMWIVDIIRGRTINVGY